MKDAFKKLNRSHSSADVEDSCVKEQSVTHLIQSESSISPLARISIDRLVKSIAKQTAHPIKISSNADTQTENCIVNKDFLYSVNGDVHNLPLVNVSISKNTFNFLIDTGSSVSFISQNLFNQLKQNLTYKHLATNVSLTTVNSKVHFSACIQTSIKIKNKSYRHNFYLVNIPLSSEFVGILGFDFVNKYYHLEFTEKHHTNKS